MTYDASFSDSFRQVGVYVGPHPVLQSTKFEFVINLQTARGVFTQPRS
jgi:hypothetical protein